MKAYRKRKDRKSVFQPDQIKTEICKAIERDLGTLLHEYEGTLTPGKSMLIQRQMAEFTKKYCGPRRDTLLRDRAFEKFLKVNDHMANFRTDYRSQFLGRPIKARSDQTNLENILVRARTLMHYVLTPFLDEEWFQYCKHGTGSSIGVSFKDTSLEAKSTFPLSVTQRCSSILNDYLLFDSQLNSALLYFNEAIPTGTRYNIVDGSRATTVTKNNTIDRMIAVEPTGNMFLQQGLMGMMYDRMAAVGLNVESLPDMHKQRARLASITSNEATIDWSSASDCMSIELLRWLLPPKWFECCERVRSPRMQINDTWYDLNMFSTMGNAVTFPLETLVFWTMAHAVRLSKQRSLGPWVDTQDLTVCSVFGDDCIVPSTMASDFIQVMSQVGFIVNVDKTFFDDGGFRESCGGDYLHGCDVRPYFLGVPANTSLSSLEPWLYIIANSLIKKYRMCFGERDYVYAKELFRTLTSIWVEHKVIVKLIPPYFPDDAGLKMSDDIERFVRCYPDVKLSRVSVNQHGSYSFLYCKFQYKQFRRRHDDLHYATWLKRPGGECSPWWYRKEKGGYIVARGSSGHWSVPMIYSGRP